MTGVGLMKSVSLFLSSGRRASLARRDNQSSSDGGNKGVAPGGGGTKGVSPTGGSREGAAQRAAQSKRKQQRTRMNEADVTTSGAPGGMGAAEGGKLQQQAPTSKLVESLRRQTHFSRQEIEALCRVYKKLVSTVFSARLGSNSPSPGSGIAPAQVSGEGLNRMMFRELLHNTFDVVTEEVLMDRIFCAFDRQSAGSLRLDDWLLGLSVFLRGTPEERATFAFFVYDLNNDGFISREEMFLLLRNSLVKHPQDDDPDEGVRDLVELALRKMDYDHDGRISVHDFRAAVSDEPLLLEAFGQCLPTHNSANTFLATLV